MRAAILVLALVVGSGSCRADGAIAIGAYLDPSTLAFGLTVNSTREAAPTDALQACTRASPRRSTTCQVVVRFTNACAAVADVVNSQRLDSYALGFAENPASANEQALRTCADRRAAGEECRIIRSACDGNPAAARARVVQKQSPTPPSCALTTSPRIDRKSWELIWNSSYGQKASLDGVSVERAGRMVVTPSGYTAYKLIVEGIGGSTDCTTYIQPHPPVTLGSL